MKYSAANPPIPADLPCLVSFKLSSLAAIVIWDSESTASIYHKLNPSSLCCEHYLAG